VFKISVPPPRPPKLDFSQIPSKADVFLEVKTPEMVTFCPEKPGVPTNSYSKMVSPIVVTTPSEADLGVRKITF